MFEEAESHHIMWVWVHAIGCLSTSQTCLRVLYSWLLLGGCPRKFRGILNGEALERKQENGSSKRRGSAQCAVA